MQRKSEPMDATHAIDMTRQALMLVLVLAAPVLVAGLVVSLIVSVLQALTQIQEQTISLVPRILAMLVAVILAGPWMIERLVEFGSQMFSPSW